MDKVKASRRGILGVAAVALTAGAVPALAAGKAEHGVSANLKQLISEHAKAVAASDAHEAIYEPIRLRWLEAKEKLQEVYPHVFQDMGENVYGGRAVWSTSDAWQVRSARRLTQEPVRFEDAEAGAEYLRRAKRFVRKAERRERIIAEAEARARAECNIDVMYERGEALSEAIYMAVDRIAEYPVASLEDLAAKLAFMREVGAFDRDDAPDIVIADVNRLIGAVA